MEAIGLNPIRLDRIGLDPIRINAIKLGVPGAAFGTDRPYIDPEVLASLKAVCICYGKSNDDPDRAIVKNLVDPDNPFVISNAAYTEGSGYADKGSPYYGAFVTDGIDDLITSTKTVQEMLGGSNEITVVSMIHQIDGNVNYTNGYTNYIRHGGGFIRNSVTGINGKGFNKTGIYGYTSTQLDSSNMGLGNVINNILGDKDDYSFERSSTYTLDDAKYSVQNFVNANNQPSNEGSSVAWYWTIIANKVLTTDQINQVIAYFNLDRTLNPDILCNTIKQGITNENHAEFGDKLIDFSGNGRDIQLNNIAWKGDSGIGKYETELSNTSIWTKGKETTSSPFSSSYNGLSGWIVFANTELTNSADMPSFKIQVKGLLEGQELIYRYYDSNGQSNVYSMGKDGEYTLPSDVRTAKPQTSNTSGFQVVKNETNIITITQIPSHAGALCLDGVNDFGKVTGMPIYKDYTFIIDYERISYASSERWVAGVVSKSHVANQGAFILMTANTTVEPGKQAYSFGGVTSFNRDDFTRALVYQSKYKCGDVDLTVGEGVDSNTLWLGTFRDNDQRFFNGAIYSLMSFPYSMSEFLIERQLKKHKLGTLYPDMVEFRPIVKSNSEYKVVDCYIDTLPAVVGNYYPINSKLRIAVSTKGAADEVTSLTVNGVSLGTPSVNGNRFTFNGTLSDKSPQKINITIDEYIRYEDIVQPYPVLLRFNDENGNEVSWGGKFRVGSTITRIGSAADSNLLPNIYNIFGLLLNDNQVTSSKVIVEKTMVFKAKSAYIFDNNEPNCILSPRLLRIPNSSYKILGYIPDISGHGNHGKINNSSYAGASGANGYLQNFSGWTKASGVSSTDSVISSSNNLVAANGWIAYVTSGTVIPTFKVEISGIPINGNLRFEGSDQTLVNGVNTIQGLTTTKVSGFYISNGYDNDWSNLRIEQIGEYEGAYCLDGVDDFVTIPTATGGKQVFMKVNSRKSDCYLYDQRNNWTQYLGIVSTKDFIAYNYSNQRGKTYIDGILNENITANDLISITHNITVTNNRDDVEQYFPCIGTSFAKNSFAQMSLYDFMLFDNISTDDKIKELNEYVGIEGNVWGILTQLSNSTLISNETLIKNE